MAFIHKPINFRSKILKLIVTKYLSYHFQNVVCSFCAFNIDEEVLRSDFDNFGFIKKLKSEQNP